MEGTLCGGGIVWRMHCVVGGTVYRGHVVDVAL